MQINGRLQYFEGPGMHYNRSDRCLPVETRHIAFGLMKAHEIMNVCDRLECLLYGKMHLRLRGASSFNLNKCAQQRSRAPDAI